MEWVCHRMFHSKSNYAVVKCMCKTLPYTTSLGSKNTSRYYRKYSCYNLKVIRKKEKLYAIFACGSAFALWGLNTPLIKASLLSVPLFSLLAFKYAVAAVVFSALAITSWQSLKKATHAKIFIATIFGYVLTSIAMYKGIQMTGGLNASLIYLLTPLFIFTFSVHVLKERYNGKLFFGVFLGLIGAILLVSSPLLVIHSATPGNPIGNLLIMVAVL